MKTTQTTKALQLVSRYSLPPNSLGYCGKDSAPEKFKNCIKNGICSGIEEEVSHFIVLNPYLETLKKITGRPKFSYENIEAYWIGNDSLKKAKNEHYDVLMKNFEKQGVPGDFINELRKNPPKKFIPHHMFQVLHVGVGRSSGSVPFNLDSINNCMIRWGKITKITKKFLTAELNSLKIQSKKFKLVKKIQKFEYDPEILGDFNLGSIVTVHWKIPIKILTDGEARGLQVWTNEVLKSIN